MVYHDHSFIFPLLILRMEKFVVFANCSVKSAVEIRVSNKMPALQSRSGVAAGMLIQDCIYFTLLIFFRAQASRINLSLVVCCYINMV